jgi:superfamily II DNA or RNA helicase
VKLIDRIAQDLDLRTPQKAALRRLDSVLENIPDLGAPLGEIEGNVSAGGFERFDTNFPSFCFHIATAVGKTRLMGACIAYLYQARGWRNYFILTKGSTIYEKTIANFSKGNSKYVLQGNTDLPEFEIITGDNYERAEVGTRLQRLELGGYVTINIFMFNVEKLFDTKDEQRRFREYNETLGGSLAALLAAQPDLVLLMDESHRYRAKASMQTINDLKPLLGLEFTATPASKNIIYRYDLGQAIRDSLTHLEDTNMPSGFIKVPVVLGRRDMHINDGFDAFEEVQLRDGIARHRRKKAEIEAYCRNNNYPFLLPIVLISTKDINHANSVREKIESDGFFNGEYKGRTVVTHSRSGDLSEDDIQGLLQLEEPNNDKEIVIHVNKLREGWDVKNVYTIIPLRAAKSAVLTEQTIGRGLRLPFGKQTGIEDLDTLEITAHEHFTDIVREAHANVAKTGMPIRTKELSDKDREDKEVRTIAPIPDSLFLIEVPHLRPELKGNAHLVDFDIAPTRDFSTVAPALVGITLGGSDQRIFDVPLYEMSEDPLRYLVRVVFDKCNAISATDENDRRLVPELIRRYLTQIDGEGQWKQAVQAHSTEIVAELVHQIKAHVVDQIETSWSASGETIAWGEWHTSVPKGYMTPNFTSVADDECIKRLIGGYKRSIYSEAVFDSKQEKWLADIMDQDASIRAWMRIPSGQFEIFHGAGDYNPDLLADDTQTIYLIEVKAANQITTETVQRKASAARAWCNAATEVGLNGRMWAYKLVPHDCIQPTDSFKGVMSKVTKS